MEATWDKNGDIDRESFLGEVVERQAEDRRDIAEARQITALILSSSARRIRRADQMAGADGFLHPALGFRPRDRGDLRPDRRRIYAAVADVADDQFCPGRIRHAAGVLHPGGDESRARRSGSPSLIGIALSIVVLGLLFKLIVVDPMLKHGVLPLVISTIALSLFLKETAKNFYSSQAQPFPALVAADRRARLRRGGLDAKPGGAGGRHRHRRGAASVAQQDAARPPHAGDRAKPDAGAHPRHPGAADGALHVSDQRRASRHRLDPDQPDLSRQIHQWRNRWAWRRFLAAIIGGFNQVRGAILGGFILGMLDNLSAAYLSSHYRGAFPLLILIAVILLRPQGLLGRVEERTV